MTNPAIDKKTVGISPIWILPIIALVICGWLFYQSIQNRGVEIVIYFNDASGITPGKTQVVSMGLPIGLVTKLYPELHNGRIKTIVEMDRDAEDALVKDTVFWVVRPEISAARVYGLETILSGSYIGVSKGRSTVSQKEFIGLTSPPPISENAPGLHFTIQANSLQSIQAGSGIYYKNIQVGSIQNYTLNEDDDDRASIMLQAFVQQKFAHLVKPESRFVNTSGLSLSGNLPNISVQVESLSALLLGGITLETPEEARHSHPIQNGYKFKLYENRKETNFVIPMTLTLSSGAGIVEGVTKVMFRGLEAGYVKKIEFNKDEAKLVTAHIMLDPRAKLILREGTRFYLAGPTIRGGSIKNLNTILSGPFITFEPGGGEFKNHFEILPEPPPIRPARPGKMYTLQSTETSSVSIGSPIHFKGVKVGEVVDTTLKNKTAELNILIYIYQPYLQYISEQSLFYVDHAFKLDAGFDKIEIESSPLNSIIQGGISFYTATQHLTGKDDSPIEYTSFSLYSDQKRLPIQATPAKGVHLQLLADNIGSITAGAPILYKKVVIGKVLSFSLDNDQIIINCLIKDPYKKYLHGNSIFYESSGIEINGDLSDINIHTGSLQSILRGGITLYNPGTGAKPSPPNKRYSLFSSYSEAATSDLSSIFVTFSQSNQLKVGASLKYKGVDAGQVVGLSIDNLPSFTAEIKVNHGMEKYFTDTARFWLASPEVSLEGISHLDTVIFGPYIAFTPGDGGKQQTHFKAQEKAPDADKPGLKLILEGKSRGSLTVGAPIYYRRVPVGNIVSYDLDETFQKVLITIIIQPKYSSLIRENTQFWLASGLAVEGGIFAGLTIQTESVEALIRGGIALATPNNDGSGKAVTAGHHFTLQAKAKSEWLQWSPDISMFDNEQEVE